MCAPGKKHANKEKNMVRHIVMFWLKDKSPEVINEAAQKLRTMAGKIEGMISLEVGIDCLHSNRSCDICLTTVFDSMESLERYRTHPVHLPVQKHMHAVRESSTSADYVIE